MESIASEQNLRFQHWRRVSDSARARRESGDIWLEGARLVREGIQSAQRGEVDASQMCLIVEADAALRPDTRALVEASLACGVPGAILPNRLWSRLSQVEQSQGMGLLMPKPLPSLGLDEALRASGSWQDWIVLDGLQDPGNVGNLLRTAAAAGLKGAVLIKGTTEAFSPKALRAGMGAQFLLPIFEGVLRETGRSQLAAHSVRAVLTLAPHAPGTRTLWTCTELGQPQSVAWVMGQEGAGLDPQWTEDSDSIGVSIPQSAALESLNVTVAAGVCLFERARLRAAATDLAQG
ncbi:MAG: TrmH family RNA methyltransferase [Burkholderiaceae bacterium]